MKFRIFLAVIIYIGAVVHEAWTYLPLEGFRGAVSFWIFTFAYVAVWTVAELWVQLVWRKNRLLYQTMSILASISGAWLLAVTAMLCGQMRDAEASGLIVGAAFAVWLLVLYVVKLFLMYQWKSMGQLVACMDRISRGDYQLDSRRAPDNELGAMWTALERMCGRLQMREDKFFREMEYLYQYTPRNFERLFSKKRFEDIETGETVQVSATLGIIALADRETLLAGKLQRQYVQYVNRLMEVLFSQSEAEQAVFLQNGSSLENVKVIFHGQSALTAAHYSVGCMEALIGQVQEEFDTMPFMLLHTSRFCCGLAGGSRQVYPYVTSLETETLGRYVDDLRHSGTKIVVTESTWEQIKEYVQWRFIGCADSFRLYEILDACPQPQRAGKLKNKQKFERALELYYSDDLYLARSAFADILKECPEDGISRWYVFACDERFNAGDNHGGGHELFWKNKEDFS